MMKALVAGPVALSSVEKDPEGPRSLSVASFWFSIEVGIDNLSSR